MHSLYAVMLILAFLLSFFEIQNQERELNVLPVYAVQQEQEQTGEPKAGQVSAFYTLPSFFYPVTHNLLNASPVSGSSKNQEIVTDNSKEFLTLPNRMTLKEYPVPSGSRPHDVTPSISVVMLCGILHKPLEN